MIEETLEKAFETLGDDEIFWEAASIEGVTYPFATSMFNISDTERNIIRNKMAEHDAKIAKKVTSIIAESIHEDEAGRIVCDAAIGEIFRKQLLQYAIDVMRANNHNEFELEDLEEWLYQRDFA